MDVDGTREWFYNVTNVIDCIDEANSVKRASGIISKEAFVPANLPREAALFKDPRTARTRIYANDAAKTALEELMTHAAITGAAFADPGAPVRSARSTA
jgi:hypothetical protein